MQKKRVAKADAKKQTADAKSTKKQTADAKSTKKDIITVSTSSKGGIMVDHKVPNAPSYTVLSAGDKPLSCYFMWSDIKDNHNKYYIAQGLVSSSGQHYLWTRYGRAGLDGVGTNQPCSSLDTLTALYNKKYREKTKKGYTEVKMALVNPNSTVEGEFKKIEPKKADESKLPKSKLDAKIGYDVKRLPLGQLDKETVLEGYKYLTEIEKVLNGKSKGDLADLLAKFYTYIPHNFGMKNMSNFTIKTHEILKQKIDLIQNLIDIKVAHKIVNPKKPKKQTSNPLDEKYDALNCKLVTVKEDSEDRKMVEQYLENSKDGRRLKLLDLFEVSINGEDKTYNPQKLGTKKLLWIGSRFSNFGGILSQGLRIAPPEAPKTGYLFGKGAYFADMAGKSAPYCCADLSKNSHLIHYYFKIGLFLLCEVALGNPRQLYQTDCDADNLPNGFHSTHGVGTKHPNPKEAIKIDKDIEVPFGKSIANPDKQANRSHNEFIVYNTNQVKMRYLFKVQFN